MRGKEFQVLVRILSVLTVNMIANNVLITLGADFYYPNSTEIMWGPTLVHYCSSTTFECESSFSKMVFATSLPLQDRNWTVSLFPDLYDQYDDSQTCGTGSKYMFMDNCCGIHAPDTPYHPSDGLNVSFVEKKLTHEWNNVLNTSNSYKYSPFFDNNVAFWSNDLSHYHKIWTTVGADIIYLKWKNDLPNDNKIYYSMITHNGNHEIINSSDILDNNYTHLSNGSTMTQYELISDTFTSYENGSIGNIIFVNSESRAYFSNYFQSYSDMINTCNLYQIGPRRGVSNVTANVNWYKTMFNSSITNQSLQIIMNHTFDYNGNMVKYAHIKLSSYSNKSTTISFFERNNEQTQKLIGFTIKEFEDRINRGHNISMTSPYCGIDRWFDMHYAMSLEEDILSQQVLYNIMLSGNKYTVFEGAATFLYLPEPNGQCLQLTFGDNGIKWYLEPDTWSADWCPSNCTNAMANYTFGEAIFEWITSSKNKNDNDSINTLIIVIIVVASLVICVVVVVFIINGCKKRAMNDYNGNSNVPKENTSLLEN